MGAEPFSHSFFESVAIGVLAAGASGGDRSIVTDVPAKKAAAPDRPNQDQSMPISLQNLSAPGWRGVTMPLMPVSMLISMNVFF